MSIHGAGLFANAQAHPLRQELFKQNYSFFRNMCEMKSLPIDPNTVPSIAGIIGKNHCVADKADVLYILEHGGQ